MITELMQEQRWELVQKLMERVSQLETARYHLEQRVMLLEMEKYARVYAPYIPDPAAPTAPTTGTPVPPWPEITCGTHDRPGPAATWRVPLPGEDKVLY